MIKKDSNYKAGFPGKAGMGTMVVIVGAALLLLPAIVAYRTFSGAGGEALPLAAFASEPKAFAGNVYRLEARIDTLLGYEEGVGRLLLTREVATDKPVPVFVPSGIEGFSPNPGQIYRFHLKVDGDGTLQVERAGKR